MMPIPSFFSISKNSPHYPSLLSLLHDPPEVLYCQGNISLTKRPRPWIAVVGTRRASPYALRVCRHLVKEMCAYPSLVISGMALGVDGIAHKSALEFNLPTIGVLGTAIDRCYPSQHRGLYQEMREKALLISEYAPLTHTQPWHFLRRNRMIAILADAVIVVEAPEKSGALATARLALDMGKDIFVVPGAIDSPCNRGGNLLIQQGAYLLSEVGEVFEVLGVKANNNCLVTKKSLSNGLGVRAGMEVGVILDILRKESMCVDKIVSLSHLAPPLVTSILTELSLEGLVEELPNQSFMFLGVDKDI